MNNTNQFLAGLNPTCPASLFRILSIEPTGSDLNALQAKWERRSPGGQGSACVGMEITGLRFFST
jgi:hypothetical protein